MRIKGLNADDFRKIANGLDSNEPFTKEVANLIIELFMNNEVLLDVPSCEIAYKLDCHLN